MWAVAKAVLLIARYFRRIAIALETISSLYRLDLQERGIVMPDKTVRDETEISYGAPVRADFD